jgi:6-phosphofructokinase 1
MFNHSRETSAEPTELELNIDRLGEPTYPSPMRVARFTSDAEAVIYETDPHLLHQEFAAGRAPASFESAGPRERLFFDPNGLRAGIVTCGGLCPGINDVIRAIVLSLYHHYGVETIYGFRYGYEGLNPDLGHEPLPLSPARVEAIGELGGTILGTSRGDQDVGRMVDTLATMGVSILFTIGGDGTLRGAGALAAEVARRGLPIAVVGVPKTIDNDISLIERSFGFVTAMSEARRAIQAAHNEATAARNGIGLVKLMGRESGFIAAYSALADSQVNFCLVPESPFTLEGLLPALRRRLAERGHAVIAVAEGAGQDLVGRGGRDASGNVKFGDIGLHLKETITTYCADLSVPITLKYIDPSYTIRSLPANAYDSAYCLLLGFNAVHAAMSGRTNMVVGYWNNHYTHVPIPAAVRRRKRIDTNDWLWTTVLMATGQPPDLTTLQ